MHQFRTSFAALAAVVIASTIGVMHAGAHGYAALASDSSPAPAASPVVVLIKDFAFVPSTLTIPVGTSVTWKNVDTASHTATDAKGAFDSGNLDTGKSFTFTFTKAGTYHYVCTYHQSMVATIIVGAPSSSSGATATR